MATYARRGFVSFRCVSARVLFVRFLLKKRDDTLVPFFTLRRAQIDEPGLNECFGPFGEISDVHVAHAPPSPRFFFFFLVTFVCSFLVTRRTFRRSRETKASRGFAFVTFRDAACARGRRDR